MKEDVIYKIRERLYLTLGVMDNCSTIGLICPTCEAIKYLLEQELNESVDIS